MTEMGKTMLFVAVAVIALLGGFVIDTGGKSYDVQEDIGKLLNEFDSDTPKELRIVKFDAATAETHQFEVAEQDGLWVIPSKQDYPADAARQMGEAANCLMDLEILRIAAESANQHQELGVVDPSSSNLTTSAQGVGIRVEMVDGNGESLTDMIIGKGVKDAEGQYYIRNADQDVVYVVQLDPEKLSTRFEDWIEDDLLQLNPMDIRRVLVKDYSAELRPALTPDGRIQMQVGWDRRGEMTLRYDDQESKWLPELLQEFDPNENKLVNYSLGEEQQLNEDALSKLRNGLDDLVIVDVERKPEGFSADLKAGSDFLNDGEAATSLATLGFAPVGGDAEILSSEGEVICSLANGVEYVLRFGNLQLDGEQSSDASTNDETEPSDDENTDITRYLFVMARFNDSLIPAPEQQELPPLPEDDSEATETAETDVEDESADTDGESTEAASEIATDEESMEAADGESTEQSEEPDEPSEREKVLAEREQIEKENQRLRDEHQEKIDAGKERVQQLNERFGDWYYVIPNNVYEQIHLSREQVIQAKEEAESDDANPGNQIPGLPNLPIGNPQ